MQSNDYISTVVSTIETAWESQQEIAQRISAQMAQTIQQKGSIYLFGCSHAGILTEEVFYRTGGLALLNPIFFPGFMLNTRPVTMTSKLERLPGLGKILLEENHLKAGDMLIIHSVSGRNIVPVEMAAEARKIGVFVAAITSLAYSKAVTPRHPDGKKLYEVCDCVMDNCGVVGDAAVHMEGLPEAMGPTSTCVGVALLNALVVQTVEKLQAVGVTPPVLLSANLDGGDEHNRQIFEEYKNSIFYM